MNGSSETLHTEAQESKKLLEKKHKISSTHHVL